MFTNKNEFFLQFSWLLFFIMLQGTAAYKLSCKLRVANLWILGFSSSFSLTVSISVLVKWNETRAWNSGPKASTPLFSHLWSISCFKCLYWPYHSNVIILLRTFNFIFRDLPQLLSIWELRGRLENCSLLSFRIEHPHTLRHGSRAEEQHGGLAVRLPDGIDPPMAAKLFVQEHGQERRGILAVLKVSPCNSENGYTFNQQFHSSARMQHVYRQQKGTDDYYLYSAWTLSLVSCT